MAQQRRDYRKFWAVFNRLRIRGDREECRRQLVMQYTGGRTDSLREMSGSEYEACIEGMRGILGSAEELRKWRSACLKQMQILGVDTADWSRVDAFCLDARIAGKRFAWLDPDELRGLQRKLHAIGQRGGLRNRGTVAERRETVIIPGNMAKA